MSSNFEKQIKINNLMKNPNLSRGTCSFCPLHAFSVALLTVTLLGLPSILYSQVPNSISYQAVVRDASNNLVSSQNIAVRISILKNSPSGTVEYQEIHGDVVTTTAGIMGFNIGGGTPSPGSVFTNIDWKNGSYFVKQEVDLEKDGTYDIFGDAVPLLSVPYAQHSNTANRATSAATADMASSVSGSFLGGLSLPVGTVLPFAGSSAYVDANLDGWLVCDGRPLQQAQYPELFAVIGTTYGSNGGQFLIPNLKGRFPVGFDNQQTEFNTTGKTGGSKSSTLKSENLAAHAHGINFTNIETDPAGKHTHKLDYPKSSDEDGNGFVSIMGDDDNQGDNWKLVTNGPKTTEDGEHTHKFNIQGTTDSYGGVNPTPFTNLPPYLTMSFIIKVRP